jgi:hypothetical protein
MNALVYQCFSVPVVWCSSIPVSVLLYQSFCTGIGHVPLVCLYIVFVYWHKMTITPYLRITPRRCVTNSNLKLIGGEGFDLRLKAFLPPDNDQAGEAAVLQNFTKNELNLFEFKERFLRRSIATVFSALLQRLHL